MATGCGLEEGEEIFRERYRQISEDPEADPEKIAIQVRQPLAIETYYDGAGGIDQHNKLRAAELRVDRTLATKNWARRINLGLWGICVCDTFYFWMQVVHVELRDDTPDEFFSKLADEMIENTIGLRSSRRSHGGSEAEECTQLPRLRHTLAKKTKAVGRDGAPKSAQGRCREPSCSKQSTMVCSACTHPTDASQKQLYFCDPLKKGISCCFGNHVKAMHT